MSILKINDQIVSEAYGEQATGGTNFYVADELPLTISETLDKSRYYFVNDTIIFTITLALKAVGGGYSTLDALKFTDIIPKQVTISKVTQDGTELTKPATNTVEIDNITLSDTKISTQIIIEGTIANATP